MKRELIPGVLIEYSPQKRTIFSRYGHADSYNGSFFLQFPYTLFLKQPYDGSNILYCVFSDKPVTSETSIVHLPWMQNVYDLGRVCLRSSYSSSLRDLINLFWNQVFNFDGPFGIPALLGMFGGLNTMEEFRAIHRDGVLALGDKIRHSLTNWQNSSYDEILGKMNEPIPQAIKEWVGGTGSGRINPSYQFRWSFSEWFRTVCDKHRYGPALKDVNFDAN